MSEIEIDEVVDVEPPARANELMDLAIDWLHSKLGRTVALILTPVLLPIVGAFTFWLQDKLGINMDPAEATAYIIAVVIGAAGVVFAWVRNHGQGAARLGQAALELEQLYKAGREELERVRAQEPVHTLYGGTGTTFYYGAGGELGDRPDTEPAEAGAQPDEPPTGPTPV